METAQQGKLIIEPRPFVLRDPRSIPPRRHLYGGHYTRGFVSGTLSPGGIGKTSLQLVEAVAMATGKPLLGIMPLRPLRVWYWNLEDPYEEIERRIAAICQHYKINQSDLGGRLFVNSGRDTPLVIATRTKDGVTILRPVVDGLIAAIRRRQIDVIIVDPFISSHQVPENDNGGIDQVIKEWGHVADVTDSAIEHAHHVRKPGNGNSEIDENDGRGASSAKDGWRSVRVLNPMSENEAKEAGIKGKQRRSYFRTDIPKGNMVVASDKAIWHKFVSIELGNGTDEYPDGDKIGVVTKWEMPGAFDGASVQDIGKIQALLSEQEWAKNSQAENWVGHAVAEVTGLNVHDEKDKPLSKNASRRGSKAEC